MKFNTEQKRTYDQIHMLMKQADIPVDSLCKQLQEDSREEKTEEVRHIVEEHAGLVGRCYKQRYRNAPFPEMFEYYKVISERSFETSGVTCLVFSEHPAYWFDYCEHEEWEPGDGYLGKYYYEGIHTDILYVNDLDYSEYVPITAAEYDEAMNRYICELQHLKWPADHNRWGRKRPGEPGWDC